MPIGELAALSTALLWATSSTLFEVTGRQTTPLAANGFKTVAASFLFALVFLLRDGFPVARGIDGGDLGLLVLSGLAGLTMGDSLLFMAFQVLGTRRSMLLVGVAPIMGAVGGILFLGETLAGAALLGIVITLAGVMWVLAERRPSAMRAHGRRLAWGVALGLGAALGQAVGALLTKVVLTEVDTLAATQVRVAAGAVGIALIGALTRQLFRWIRLLMPRPVFGRAMLASFLGPFLGIWCMVIALDHTSTGVALTLMSTPPIWLLILGTVLGNDRPSLRETIGVITAIAGIAVLLLAPGG